MPDRHLEFAREALLDITPESTIGAYVGSVDEGDGVVTVRFESAMPGYPGWQWTVSLAVVDGGEPTVLETELMPGEGALLAPDWVPWSDRLAEYKAAQEAAEAEALDGSDDDADDDSGDDDADDDDDDDDDADDDDDDDDLLGSDVLHGGDLDGVDIDDPDVLDELDEDFGDGEDDREEDDS
ncbi:DUF3027 domain-containing protein [Leifsonia sp. H3M29-4]|uniref:DUF3027 domain-containing protein n=1 Tax=Salinibacterium metalliresistens TaxID=3031321 RepID=UPI0023DC09D7|nr:DUF3027 domain-containing protein [Salinibacterium metalliresistens]MDF1478138.1 DUF3027 domain-containing protein [Salinibacterium metalliresistens]